MTEHIGTLLWEWRTRAGLSLGLLAQRAGVSKAALSRWEAGTRQPRIPELEAALDALGISPAQRALAFSRIEKPRALRHLQTAPNLDGLNAPPSAGDLLRAMRLRGGWTQEQIAAKIGAGQNTMARWERGNRLPSNEQMQRLCFAMEAREEELLALTTGQFAEVPSAALMDIEVLQKQPVHLLFQENLQDLRFWIFERDLWNLAARDEALRPILADTYACHAHILSNHLRWSEVEMLASRALALTQRQEQEPEWALRAVLKLAAAVVYGGRRPMPERGLQLLRQWFPRSSQPDFTAWMLSDMAEYEALAGQPEHGVALAQQAVRRTVNEQEMRRIDLCRALNTAGRPGEALAEMIEVPEIDQGIFVYAAFVRIESHLLRNENRLAHDWLDRAFAVIRAYDLERHRVTADALMQRLGMQR